jgi:ABC-type nitrate/sulfonate/bicarbonate transport system substrate-binding protein
VHFYGDTIYSTDDYIAGNPDVVLRFLQATLRGWTYAVENPNEVGEIVSHYNPEADIDLENAEMLASLPLINTGEDPIGWMSTESWVDMKKTLLEQGVLTAPLKINQVYTMQFLEEIYK